MLITTQHTLSDSATIYPQAAAVVLLIVRGREQHLLLTKRSATLRVCPNDWCFPGGKHDTADGDLLATAWRELYEETHLSAALCQPMLQLDDFFMAQRCLVRPYVMSINEAHFLHHFQPQENELSDSHLLPLTDLDNIVAGTPAGTTLTRDPAYQLSFWCSGQHHWIWGLTATLLACLANILNQRNFPIDKGKTLQLR